MKESEIIEGLEGIDTYMDEEEFAKAQAIVRYMIYTLKHSK